MKTTIKRLSVLLLAICMICALAAPLNVQAAVSKTTKNKLKELVECMGTFEWYILSGNNIEVGEVREVPMEKTVMAKAAAFNCEFKYVSVYGDFEMESLYTVSAKNIKSMAKKMFGKKVTYKDLPQMTAEDVRSFIDAYRNAKGKVEIYQWEGETETDLENIKVTYKKSGKGYIITEDVYYGYWGINSYYEHKKSNYRITYTVKKKKGSTYGYVITGMTIEQTADLTSIPDDEGEG